MQLQQTRQWPQSTLPQQVPMPLSQPAVFRLQLLPAVVAGKRSSVVTAKEYAAAALASKAAEEDDME
jgi:hypothetical protein